MISSQDQSISKVTSTTKDKFPMKLHRILSNPKFNKIIAWQPHGRSWRVLEPKMFENEVLPLYFRHRNYSSFMRQVNGWGFRRVQKGVDRNTFYHVQFLRGMPHICSQMERPKKEQNQSMSDSYVSVVPTVYSTSPDYLSPEEYPVWNTTRAIDIKRKIIESTQTSNISDLGLHINEAEHDVKRIRLSNIQELLVAQNFGSTSNRDDVLQQRQRDLITANATSPFLNYPLSIDNNTSGVTASEAKLRSIQMDIMAVEREIYLRQQKRQQNQLLSRLSYQRPVATTPNTSLESFQKALAVLQYQCSNGFNC